MGGPLQRALSAVLPLSMQRRRITQATELILSNVNLYASVGALYLADGGRRVVVELRAPVALPAQTIEALRRYVARKLHQTIGLRLSAERMYLVSLPPTDEPAQRSPSTSAMRQHLEQLPEWPRSGATPSVSRPAANDSILQSNVPPAPAATRGAAATPPAQARQPFDLPEDPRWSSGSVHVRELSASEVANGFAATQPAAELPVGAAAPPARAREKHGGG